MDTQKWQAEPPASAAGSPKYDWVGITKGLRRRPGKWLLVAEGVSRSLYTAITRGRILALRDRDWVYEARTRNNKDGKADIWMSARPRTAEEMNGWDSRR